MGFDILHSIAYHDLNYAPSLKLLNWFHEKVRMRKIPGKRGVERYEPVNEGDIVFTYREGCFRGLSPQKFRKALKELHFKGFVDVKRPGSGLEGDTTIYRLSHRWQKYGTANFEKVGYPKSNFKLNSGFQEGNKEYLKRHDILAK